MTTPMISVPLFGVGMTEWIIIGAAILLFFGASKLPKLGKGLGEGIRNFKSGIKGELDESGNPIAKPGEAAAEEKSAPASETAAEPETETNRGEASK